MRYETKDRISASLYEGFQIKPFSHQFLDWRHRSAGEAYFRDWRSFSAAILLWSVFILGPGSHAQAAHTTADESKPKVVAAFPHEFPPQYQIGPDGAPTGFAIDVLNAVAERAGLRVSYRPQDTWNDAHGALISGSADLVPNMGITPARETLFDFTRPVETFAVAVFTRKVNNEISSVDDLNGRRVGTVVTNVAIKLLEGRIGEDDLVVYNEPREALFALMSAEIDAFVYPEPVVRWLARKAHVEDRIKRVGAPLLEVKRGIAVRRGNTALLEKLNRALESYLESGEYGATYARWYRAPEPFWTAFRVALAAGIILIAVSGAMSYWRQRSLAEVNYAMAREVTRRKAIADDLGKSLQTQSITASMLRIGLKPEPLDESLNEILKLVLTRHGLKLEEKGAIFLVDGKSDTLVMKASHNLPESLLKACATVRSGKCHCGRVAKTGELIHVSGVEDHHDMTYDGMTPYGHYCAPIKMGGEILGVLNVYLPEGHQATEAYDKFIEIVTDTLAGVIQRKQVEQALIEREERLRLLVQNMPVILDAVDEAGNIIVWNREAERASGYRAEEMIGNPDAWERLYPDQEYRESMLNEWKRRGDHRAWEWRLNAKDGSERFVEWSNISNAFPIPGWASWGIGVDVTQRKKAEDARSMLLEENRRLARRLLTVQEDERRRLARELHDELAQNLIAINLHTKVIRRGVRTHDADLLASADLIEALATQTVATARDVMERLRPTLLDDVDLVTALTDSVDKWQSRQRDVHCAFSAAGELDSLEDEVNIALYRIVQESLTNVAKHAQATEVRVQLQRTNHTVHLRVRDNGRGVKLNGSRKGLGLLGMRERAESLNGRFDMQSRPGQGMTISATIPVQR